MTHPSPPSDCLLRVATEADASLMAVVEASDSESGWPESRIHQELVQQTSRSWIVIGKEPLAYVLTREVEGEWEIINLMVVASYRRQGFARMLMEAALTEVKATQGHTVFLGVRFQNVPAQFLYISLGFEPYGQRKGYYLNPDDDALIMRLDLPSGTGIGAKPE